MFDYPTPCLLLDETRLTANLERMKSRADALKVLLRPHLKTAKSAAVAERALRPGDPGVTVSTVAELEYFAGAGFRDMTYAVGVTPDKLERIAAVQNAGATVTLLLDNLETVAGLAAKARFLGQSFNVLIEIDCGGHRGGVPAESPLLMEIAEALNQADCLQSAGVLTHAGHSYKAATRREIAAIAEDERRAAVAASVNLREAGHACPTVSVGSTPTALFAEHLDGVTEMRPGVYMFFDRYQANLGCCSEDDIALSVLASIIGRREDLGYALIDAGALALSQDVSTEAQEGVKTYGAVYDDACRHRLADLAVAGVNQEHGFIRSLGGDAAALPAPGTRVRIIPNHACMTAAAFDHYRVVSSDGVIKEVWVKATGW